jgi:hypothetical protein
MSIIYKASTRSKGYLPKSKSGSEQLIALIGSMEKRTRLWRFWLNATGVAFHRRMIIRRHQA